MQATKGRNNAIWLAQECDSPLISAACNKPLLTADAGDSIRINAVLNSTKLRTAGGLAPEKVVLRLCFSKPFTVDRPWRKPNDKIDMDKSCPHTVGTFPLAANGSYSADWKVPKGAPKATWYAQVMVVCQNGTGPVYCATDSTKGKNFVGTQIISSTPTSMKVAVGICSAIAPAFLAAFFVKERMIKKST